jgi:hypothetical protein
MPIERDCVSALHRSLEQRGRLHRFYCACSKVECAQAYILRFLIAVAAPKAVPTRRQVKFYATYRAESLHDAAAKTRDRRPITECFAHDSASFLFQRISMQCRLDAQFRHEFVVEISDG